MQHVQSVELQAFFTCMLCNLKWLSFARYKHSLKLLNYVTYYTFYIGLIKKSQVKCACCIFWCILSTCKHLKTHAYICHRSNVVNLDLTLRVI